MNRVVTLLLVSLLALWVGSLLAGDAVVVDKTRADYQYQWYTGSYGDQILVDENGKVHATYAKTYMTETDTGYAIMYANVTDGTKLTVPLQETTDITPYHTFIDGGYGAPIYVFYGVGARNYGYGPSLHKPALAKLSADGSTLEPLGVQEDKMYWENPWYSIPIDIEVDPVNGVAHCMITNPSGQHVAYFLYDGTTGFGEVTNMVHAFAVDGVPGVEFDPAGSGLIMNGTKGCDLAVNADGSEVTAALMLSVRNVALIKGKFGGLTWPTDLLSGMADGSVVFVYDTTNSRLGTNIPNNDPKPCSEVRVRYDADNNLHVVYDATYFDVFLDTTRSARYWTLKNDNPVGLLYGNAGDTSAVFYDGSVHPKPQIHYWSSTTGTHQLLAECAYPAAGQTYNWIMKTDTALYRTEWGKWINDYPIASLKFIVNKDPQPNEPKFVVVWEEMQGDIQQYSGGLFGTNYYAYGIDIKASRYDDATGWSAPYNITNTPNLEEKEISVYKDVIDNKIHLLFTEDDFLGSDRNIYVVADVASRYKIYATPWGNRPFRLDEMNIKYMDFDLSNISTGVDSRPDNTPATFELAQNHPNPFNPNTSIKYTVPNGKVTLEVFNALGQKVKTLVDKQVVAGTFEVAWDGTDLTGQKVASGVYFYKLNSDAGLKVKKMLLQK